VWTPERRKAHGLKMRALHAARPLGFRALDEVSRREIASSGGRAVQDNGTGHRWTLEEARIAGRKGGITSRGGRGKLPQ